MWPDHGGQGGTVDLLLSSASQTSLHVSKQRRHLLFQNGILIYLCRRIHDGTLQDQDGEVREQLSATGDTPPTHLLHQLIYSLPSFLSLGRPPLASTPPSQAVGSNAGQLAGRECEALGSAFRRENHLDGQKHTQKQHGSSTFSARPAGPTAAEVELPHQKSPIRALRLMRICRSARRHAEARLIGCF